MIRFWRRFFINGLWWTFIIFLWTSLTHSELENDHAQLEHFLPIRTGVSFMIALVMAFLNTVIDWLVEKRWQEYKVSFRKKMLFIFLRQFVFIAAMTLVLYFIVKMNFDIGLADSFQSFVSKVQAGKFALYAILSSYILEIIRAVDQKLGPGNLWKLMIGEFSQPKEMERIFMFADLKNSTKLAEQLGHLKYSELIQDCFHDVSVVQQYGAEVFQYVGDEVVLVWKLPNGFTSFNCIEAYFAFMARINKKSAYYKAKYGVIPFFKAGIHCGKIVLAEVGDIKREIAYHGDTINTASRIQDQCSVFNESLIVSETLINSFDLNLVKSKYKIHRLGSVSLPGKGQEVTILSLSKL